MYDIQIRNSVLSLFNGVDLEKFPDESFNLKVTENSNVQIFTRDFSADELICNLFDFAEKQINNEGHRIERVIFKRTIDEKIDILSLETLVNKLIQLLGRDECGIGEFTDKDIEQFKQGNWTGRVWFSTLTKGISLIIYRRLDIFELHLVFIN